MSTSSSRFSKAKNVRSSDFGSSSSSSAPSQQFHRSVTAPRCPCPKVRPNELGFSVATRFMGGSRVQERLTGESSFVFAAVGLVSCAENHRRSMLLDETSLQAVRVQSPVHRTMYSTPFKARPQASCSAVISCTMFDLCCNPHV